jgi:hypothetical protein
MQIHFDAYYDVLSSKIYACYCCPLLTYTGDKYLHDWYAAAKHLDEHEKAGHDVPAEAYEILGDSDDD